MSILPHPLLNPPSSQVLRTSPPSSAQTWHSWATDPLGSLPLPIPTRCPGPRNLPLFQTPHPAPNISRAQPVKESPWLRAGQHVPGWGETSALTSCSLPWAGVGERGIVSGAAQPMSFPGATLWVAPSSDPSALGPARAGPGGRAAGASRAGCVCPNDQVSGCPSCRTA